MQSKTRFVIAGVAAIAAGVTFGWSFAGMPSRIALPTTTLASGGLIPSAAASDRERVEPARDPIAPAALVEADKPAPAPTPAAAPAPAALTEKKIEGQMVTTGADLRLRKKRRHGYRVHTRSTKVSVDPGPGRVRVRAPYTSVNVDSDRGRVRVRAPYVNLSVGW